MLSDGTIGYCECPLWCLCTVLGLFGTQCWVLIMFLKCCPNSVCAGAELVVRPKTHSRESNRGMLTLAEEEGSRRNTSSPAQSPCHSLPSGRPHRRESEPVGPQRAVRGLSSQLEETWSLWRLLVDRWGNVAVPLPVSHHSTSGAIQHNPAQSLLTAHCCYT